jgi:hypothetical protein
MELSMARGAWTHCLQLYARHMIALNCDCVISVHPRLALAGTSSSPASLDWSLFRIPATSHLIWLPPGTGFHAMKDY